MSSRSSATDDSDNSSDTTEKSSNATTQSTEGINGEFADKSTRSKIAFTAISTDVTERSSAFDPSSIKWTITETDEEGGESAKSTVSLSDLASSAGTVLRAKKKEKNPGRKHAIRMEVYKRVLGSDIDTKFDQETAATAEASAEPKSRKKPETVEDRDAKIEKIFAKNADNGSKPLTTYRVTNTEGQPSTVTLYYTKKGGGGQGEFSILRWDGSQLSHYPKLGLEGLYFHCKEYGSTIEADSRLYTDAEEYLNGLIDRGEISKTAQPAASKSKKKRKK
ncbi:hypothetical protein I317_05729 [Kwoniella heveanensis CBS 569]|uniref:Uncharacterized protein n=1 Tax=Kwoniella heveanensis BCC8398 TaxID=1296120 RepID=A0A1B9H0I6_9TREE|nr:hypothetical protein I316_01353 [Kwoniella heveanensis BCC8398]OCF40491.1 hypothetical protein I317_05729 [Kwoniella heveanensis CBS 569]